MYCRVQKAMILSCENIQCKVPEEPNSNMLKELAKQTGSHLNKKYPQDQQSVVF